jgi:signal transduction histidine kinase
MAYFLIFEAFFSVCFFVAYFTRAYAAIPHIWAAIGFGSFAAIIYGVKYYKPSKSLGWKFWAAAVPMMVIGDILYSRNMNRTSFADFLYLAGYVVSITGLTLLIRHRAMRDVDKGVLLDAAIISLGLAMILWTFLVLPNAYVETSFTNKLFAVTYPVLNIVFLAVLIRLVLVNLRVRAAQLIAIGTFGALITNIISGIGRYCGSLHVSVVSPIGLMILYISYGAAALHPSMKALDETVIKEPRVRISRLILLGSSALIAPSIMVIEVFRGNINRDALSIAVFAALMFILVIIRMYTLIRVLGIRDAQIEMERNKNETLGLVAHQLRTPATGAIQYITMVVDGYAGKTTKSQRGLLDVALTSSQRLIRIIDDLLDISRVNSGTVVLYKSESDIVQTIKDIMVEMKPQFDTHSQKLSFEHKEDSVITMVDQDRLKMVLENMLDNACKYTPDGKSISIMLYRMKHTYQIKIKDQGVGIDKKDLNKLFQKFSRIDNSLSKGAGGSGLGLNWAKLIIELHGGTIKVKSAPHKGSTFIITLPLQKHNQLS